MNTRGLARLLLMWPLLLTPAAASAQVPSGTIVGLARDTSGAVLPGVTVEAASPALIEGTRVVVTDGEGRYRIVDLRPGTYTVTFTLPGFRQFRREGLELTSGFTATLNAELAVGALEQTLIVTGEAPIVDVQSTQQQVQFGRETLQSLPGTGRITMLSQALPGASTAATSYSVGGINDRAQQNWTIHGLPSADPVIDGMGHTMPGLGAGVFVYNQATFQEVVVQTSSAGADRAAGGMQINMVQRDGGNTFSGTVSVGFSGGRLEADNVTDALVARNVARGGGNLKKWRDVAAAVGGPIQRDRLWFFGAFRAGVTQQTAQGLYWNAAQGSLFYQPDLSRPAETDDYANDYTLRLTWQATAKHRFVVAGSLQPNCNCVMFLLGPTGGIPVTPEAAAQHHYNPNVIPTFSWTYPATSRILIEGGASASIHKQTNKRQANVSPNDIAVHDLGLNLRYGSRTGALTTGGSYIYQPRWQAQQRFAVSYITTTHRFKVGFDGRIFKSGDVSRNRDPNQINQARHYVFRNGVPEQVVIWAVPSAFEESGKDFAVYAQDQWTVGRTTLNLGLRYNDVRASVPEQVLAAGPFVPERVYAPLEKVPHWRNLNPRLGASYDLFGTGRTALKVALGRYNQPVQLAVQNPVQAVTGASDASPSTSRVWNDANGNFTPDCNLLDPATNGECGPWSDLNFGQVGRLTTRNELDAREGFNRQDHHWQGSASVQHELRPGFGLNAGYFRTWYGGFLATRNEAVAASEFDEFCFTVPVDPRLPNSGQRLCGLYDVRPDKFGLFDNVVTQMSRFGKQTRVYNGVDLTVNVRFGQGGQFSGGVSLGRTVADNCVVVNSPQDAREGFCRNAPPWAAGTQVKFMAVYPLPWNLQTSVIYQNIPGIETGATHVVRNAEIAQTLRRNLAACGNRTPCNATVTVDLTPPGTMFEDRLQTLDVRVTRIFRVGGIRVRGNLDIHNIFNASDVLNLNRRYGPSWLNVTQMISGRLLKVGGQVDF